MRAFFRLLLWELASHWKQGLAIVVLLSCGIATLIMSITTMRSLEASQARYYAKYSFAHLWAPLVRAPEDILANMARIPGVQRVSGRVEKHVLLDFPEMLEPACARLVSIEAEPQSEINGLYLRRGRLPVPGEQTEVVVSELFAEEHRLKLGDTVPANLEGKRENLIVVGIGLSPDSIYVVQPGMLLPNNRLYGVLWAPKEKLAAAFNMQGAVNQVALRLGHDANTADVKKQLDQLLEPYGCMGSYDRDEQESHARVRDEMRELRTMALLSPAIFLSVSAFLVHMVFSRMILQQTEQIATLRAFGYSAMQIGGHYLQVVLVWIVLGVALGIAWGLWLAAWLSEIYRMFFRFPEMIVVRFGWEWMLAVSLGILVAFLGAISGLLRAMQLPPAVAMRSGDVTDKSAALANFRELISKSTGWMRLINAIFAMLITVGVAYNSALITFSERARDLATMRVLGYRQYEVNRVLLLELFWTMILAIPIGVPLGYLFAYGLITAMDSESHRFPFMVHQQTVLYAILVMLLATSVCGWMVIRMTKQLDLISVLKVRE
jgi:putative ABC transport system permease protein